MFDAMLQIPSKILLCRYYNSYKKMRLAFPAKNPPHHAQCTTRGINLFMDYAPMGGGVHRRGHSLFHRVLDMLLVIIEAEEEQDSNPRSCRDAAPLQQPMAAIEKIDGYRSSIMIK